MAKIHERPHGAQLIVFPPVFEGKKCPHVKKKADSNEEKPCAPQGKRMNQDYDMPTFSVNKPSQKKQYQRDDRAQRTDSEKFLIGRKQQKNFPQPSNSDFNCFAIIRSYSGGSKRLIHQVSFPTGVSTRRSFRLSAPL